MIRPTCMKPPFRHLALAVTASAVFLVYGAGPVDGADLIAPVAATAQGSYFVPDNDDRRAEHAIDGSGMTPANPVTATSVCGNNPNGFMWLSDGNTDTWVTFDLGSVQTVAGFHLWNYNEVDGTFTGRGIRSCRIFAGTGLLPDGTAYDAAGAAWGTLVGEMAFAQATGSASYAGEDYRFTTPVTTRYLQFLVASNFGTSDGYTGIAEIRFFPPASIISFGANIAGSTAAISPVADNAATIAWTVPFGTNLASLAPGFTLSSGTCDRGNGGPAGYDFRNPVTYAVTAGDVTNTYTVTATKAPPSTACDLKAFRANLAGSRASIISTGPASGNVVVNVPPDTTDAQLAALATTLTLSPGATCAIPTPPLSLSAPVHYIVTAEDGATTGDYTATVTTSGGNVPSAVES